MFANSAGRVVFARHSFVQAHYRACQLYGVVAQRVVVAHNVGGHELYLREAYGCAFVKLDGCYVPLGLDKLLTLHVGVVDHIVEEAWADAAAAILSGDWDLVVLDEINYAIGYKMLDPAKVAETLKQKPEMVHVILTGRNAHPSLVEIADTVTEMREVKHAYQKGILAQRGIEY